MPPYPIPDKLAGLHIGEEKLRIKALELIAANPQLSLHVAAVEQAMDLADLLRQYKTKDEDLRVIQMLAMRTFNAFGASMKLALSGYVQNSALIMRDILETVFLIDLFYGERALIEIWRFADKKARLKDFRPVSVREALDKRDGFTSRKRAEIYEMFSELAGHSTMKSVAMMRPQKGGDAVIGPFMEATTLDAGLSEMGRLAIQVGEQLNAFFPADWTGDIPARLTFAKTKQQWMATFYPKPSASSDNG
jgi:hypothetical protein